MAIMVVMGLGLMTSVAFAACHDHSGRDKCEDCVWEGCLWSPHSGNCLEYNMNNMGYDEIDDVMKCPGYENAGRFVKSAKEYPHETHWHGRHAGHGAGHHGNLDRDDQSQKHGGGHGHGHGKSDEDNHDPLARLLR